MGQVLLWWLVLLHPKSEALSNEGEADSIEEEYEPLPKHWTTTTTWR
jgi:hypothetical protein